jgi:hypothetical protein
MWIAKPIFPLATHPQARVVPIASSRISKEEQTLDEGAERAHLSCKLFKTID